MSVVVHRTAQRGGEFREAFDVRLDGANLSDIVVEASGAVSPGSEVMIEPGIAVDATSTGIARCVLTMTPAETMDLPERIIIDVRVRVPSAGVANTVILRVHLAVDLTTFPDE